MRKYSLILFLVLSILSCKTNKIITNAKNNTNFIISKWIKPPNLKKGDTIAIVAPASFLKDSIGSISNALDTLKSWHLNYKLYKHVFDVDGHFAGNDKLRARDFQKAIENPNIKAIWCARGGYGSVRILDKLNFKPLLEQPKWIIGYSDITAIHNELHNTGIQSIHGIMPVSLTNPSDKKESAIKSLKNALFGIKNTYLLEGSKYNKVGKSEGVLVGGNLTLLHTMLQSKTSIDTKNKILFIEDIGEKKYHIDRMLYSLKRAGYFKNCKGLVVGGFTSIKKNEPLFGKEVEEIILELLTEYNFPILFNFPAGHITDNRTLILGNKIKIKVLKKNSTLEFL